MIGELKKWVDARIWDAVKFFANRKGYELTPKQIDKLRRNAYDNETSASANTSIQVTVQGFSKKPRPAPLNEVLAQFLAAKPDGSKTDAELFIMRHARYGQNDADEDVFRLSFAEKYVKGASPEEYEEYPWESLSVRLSQAKAIKRSSSA